MLVAQELLYPVNEALPAFANLYGSTRGRMWGVAHPDSVSLDEFIARSSALYYK